MWVASNEGLTNNLRTNPTEQCDDGTGRAKTGTDDNSYYDARPPELTANDDDDNLEITTDGHTTKEKEKVRPRLVWRRVQSNVTPPPSSSCASLDSPSSLSHGLLSLSTASNSVAGNPAGLRYHRLKKSTVSHFFSGE